MEKEKSGKGCASRPAEQRLIRDDACLDGRTAAARLTLRAVRSAGRLAQRRQPCGEHHYGTATDTVEPVILSTRSAFDPRSGRNLRRPRTYGGDDEHDEEGVEDGPEGGGEGEDDVAQRAQPPEDAHHPEGPQRPQHLPVCRPQSAHHSRADLNAKEPYCTPTHYFTERKCRPKSEFLSPSVGRACVLVRAGECEVNGIKCCTG